MGEGTIKTLPRRDEVLAIIIECIARNRISPTFEEIGQAMQPRVGEPRARHLTDQLVERGHVGRLAGKTRALVVIETPHSRAVRADVYRRLGWSDGVPISAPPAPYANSHLPRLPEIRYLPDE